MPHPPDLPVRPVSAAQERGEGRGRERGAGLQEGRHGHQQATVHLAGTVQKALMKERGGAGRQIGRQRERE